jgi:hypothetical protein
MNTHITEGSYPTNASAFTLEFATNLFSPTVWQINSMPSIVIGGQDIIISPITGPQQLFRLFNP